jgi:uncharacterized protein YhfF
MTTGPLAPVRDLDDEATLSNMPPQEELPRAEFAFPGPLRDQLIAAILSGAKTATSSLVVEYELEGAPLPVVGRRTVVVDSADRHVAIIETTDVRLIPVGDVDVAHVRDEGEGYQTVADWRAEHEKFWHSDQMRTQLGDPAFRITDDTIMVAERFQLVGTV